MDIELRKLTAEKLEVKDDKRAIKSTKDVKYNIIEINEKEVSIVLTVKVEFEPVSPFIVNTEFFLKYQVIEPVNAIIRIELVRERFSHS